MLEIFTADGFEEIRFAGTPLFRKIPDSIEDILSQMEKLVRSKEHVVLLYFIDSHLQVTNVARSFCLNYKVFKSLQKYYNKFVSQTHIRDRSLPVEAYRFASSLDHDPFSEPLKVWLSVEVQSIARQFFYNETFNVDSLLEADLLCKAWGFIGTLVNGSIIHSIG